MPHLLGDPDPRHRAPTRPRPLHGGGWSVFVSDVSGIPVSALAALRESDHLSGPGRRRRGQCRGRLSRDIDGLV